MYSKNKLCPLAAVLGFFLGVLSARGQSILNPSFESPLPLADWSASSPTLVGSLSGNPAQVVPNGARAAFIRSVNDVPNTLSTVITGLLPGVVYEVTFRAGLRYDVPNYYAFNTPSPAWSINNSEFVPFSAAKLTYSQISAIFTLSTGFSAPLVIRNHTGANSDSTVLIDDFSISPFPDGSSSTLQDYAMSTNRVFYFGQTGPNTSLSVSFGGKVTNSAVFIGWGPNSHHNSLSITEPNSVFDTQGGFLEVGYRGPANSLLIGNGALMTNGVATIGNERTSSNNVVTVTGIATHWFNRGDLFVGKSGASNAMVLSSFGGGISNRFGYIGYGASSSNNSVHVEGFGYGSPIWWDTIIPTWWNNEGIYVGYGGAGNTLRITSGSVGPGAGYVGHGASASNNRVVVTKFGIWSTFRDSWQTIIDPQALIHVGYSGAGNSLLVSENGQVNDWQGRIGTFSSNNRAVITGFGSAWNNTHTFYVGDTGSGNSLWVTNGGRVVSTYGYVGNLGGYNTVTVADTASTWTNLLALTIGKTKPGNSLSITNGGSVAAGGGLGYDVVGSYLIGEESSSTNNQVTVAGPGSSWVTDVRGEFYLGKFGANNRLLVTNGGYLKTGNSTIGYNATNNQAVISGTGTVWYAGGGIKVGSANSGNALLINEGAQVTSFGGAIGENNGNNNQITVTGPGTRWTVADVFSMGYVGGPNYVHGNRVQISDGAAVSVSNRVTLNGPQLTVHGGRLQVSNLAGTGMLEIVDGTTILTNGLIDANRLEMKFAGGFFEFKSGTFKARSALISNGQVFTVGNGSTAASYQMTGTVDDAHSFGQGLVVSAAAMLSGNGYINGNVTNHGIFAPGRIRIIGNLELGSTSKINIELSATPLTSDLVDVYRDVKLGGTLTLSLRSGYRPVGTEVFTLLKYDSFSGAFQNVAFNGRLETTDGLGSFLITATGTEVTASDFRWSDNDADGVSDSWAGLHFSHSPLNAGEKAADADGDGISNYAEFMMGTNPKNAESVLKFSPVDPPAAGRFTLRFQSVANREYFIECFDLVSGAAPLRIDNPVLTSPAPGVSEWSDDGSLTGGFPRPSARYYRVGIK